MLAQKLQAAFALYQQGQLVEAEAAARQLVAVAPNSPDTQRVLGMVLSASGRHDEAEAALRRALTLAPGHVEIINSLGIAAARAGRAAQAEQAYRQALEVRPDYVPARRNLAGALISAGRAQAALFAMQGASGVDFDRLRGEAYLRLDEPELALAAFKAGEDAAPNEPRMAIGRAAALTELGRFDAALRALQGLVGPDADTARAKAHLGAGRAEPAAAAAASALAAAPARTDALFVMAQCLWMSGRSDEVSGWFEVALRAVPGSADVLRLYGRTLKQMGQLKGALAALDRITSPGPSDYAERADVLIEAGRADAALDAARAACEAGPELPAAHAGHARAALMTARAREALDTARRMRAVHPDDQFWIAMEAEALRVVDPPEWRRLCDPERVAAVYDLPVPEGFADLSAFNCELAARLRRLHAFENHPLDQSLRAGVQTAVDLRRVGDPVIDAFFKSAQLVVDAHIARMPEDLEHPLYAAKRRGGEIMSAWSVLLKSGGRHVSHVHPEGWISSAYYVETPGDLESSAAHEGWLVLGEPPFIAPGAAPTREIAARPGRLALFPSYLWHGTRPIHSGERLSIAFDIRPRAAAS